MTRNRPGLFSVSFLVAAGLACADPPTDRTSRVASMDDAQLQQLVDRASSWLDDMRAQHRPHARPLTTAEKSTFADFFSAEVLEQARLRMVPALENPGFYEMFDKPGMPRPIDFTQASGLTVRDTILIVESRSSPLHASWLPLLFHELVHVTQNAVLGDRELELYVRGWADNGYHYRSIPAEQMAFELQERFRQNPSQPFDVAQLIRQQHSGPGS